MKLPTRALLGIGVAALCGAVWAQACSADSGGSGEASTTSTQGQGGSAGMGFTGSAGSGATGFGGGCAEATSEAMQGMLPADIIIAVDNSGSMDEEAEEVQASMNDFASIIIGSGIDAHIVMISADWTHDSGICVPAPLGSGSCPDDDNLPIYRHVVQEVASTNSLQLILSTYDLWKDALRPGASKTVAVVSDDNSDLPAAAFTPQLIALDPSFAGYKFDGIVAPYEIANPLLCITCTLPCTQCDPCCGPSDDPFPPCVDLPADKGEVYLELIGQTGGVFGDLCLQDFVPVFEDMATAVIGTAQIACVYDIPDPGDGGVIDPDKVNVEFQPNPNAPAEPIYNVPGGAADCGPQGGWYYDDPDAPTQIIFCPATCDLVQASIDGRVTLIFGCETQVVPPT